MATRLLRQYYEPVATVIPDEVGATGPWVRHRNRMRDALRTLPDAEWHAATRCTDWDVKDVVSHLVTVDAYWMFAFNAARTDDPPTTLLEHFDPSSGTDVQVAALREVSNAELADRFANGTEALVQMVDGFAPADWDAIGESPLGHLPVRVLFGHAFWDSWLHERDMFVPLGRAAARRARRVARGDVLLPVVRRAARRARGRPACDRRRALRTGGGNVALRRAPGYGRARRLRHGRPRRARRPRFGIGCRIGSRTGRRVHRTATVGGGGRSPTGGLRRPSRSRRPRPLTPRARAAGRTRGTTSTRTS